MAPRDFRSRLVRRASKAGIRLTDDLSASLTAYYELLARWNRKINLTGLTDADEPIRFAFALSSPSWPLGICRPRRPALWTSGRVADRQRSR